MVYTFVDSTVQFSVYTRTISVLYRSDTNIMNQIFLIVCIVLSNVFSLICKLFILPVHHMHL